MAATITDLLDKTAKAAANQQAAREAAQAVSQQIADRKAAAAGSLTANIPVAPGSSAQG